jgi:hypothetical protein
MAMVILQATKKLSSALPTARVRSRHAAIRRWVTGTSIESSSIGGASAARQLDVSASTASAFDTQQSAIELIFQPLALTGLRTSFFLAPIPFYARADLDGVFNPFTVPPGGGTLAVTGERRPQLLRPDSRAGQSDAPRHRFVRSGASPVFARSRRGAQERCRRGQNCDNTPGARGVRRARLGIHRRSLQRKLFEEPRSRK